ncbi:MAG: DUF4340 domain-containing protein [Bauldia sp.]|nr:DUF4340 domain-containing protein [Bauldia sp.]
MTPKAFYTLAAVTGVAIVATGAAIASQYNAYSIQRPTDASFFPALREDRSAVARLVIDTPRYDLELARDGDRWVVANQGGYPVNSTQVMNLIDGLAALRPFEAKTTNPELYPEVWVEEPGSEGAAASYLEAENAAGEPLAAMIVGKISNSIGFNPLGGTFVRKPGEDQVWLAEGRVGIPLTFTDWFQQIVHVSGPDLRRITIREGGEVVFEAAKVDLTLGRYELVSVKDPGIEGEIIASDTNVKQMGQGVVSTTFDQARAESEIAFADTDRIVIFETAKEMTLSVQLHEQDGVVWAKYIATAPEGSEGAAQAAQITERTGGYAFKLPAYRLTPLQRTVASLVEPKPADGAVPQPGGDMNQFILQQDPAAAIPLIRPEQR